MAETCDECGEEIRLVAARVTDISTSGKRYTTGSTQFSIGVAAECGCRRETPKATELDSIRFNGEPPESWL